MRFSLSALFLIISGVAVVSLWASPASYTYVKTGRPNDIAIVGEAWLYGTDVKTEKRKFFKSCTLSVSSDSWLLGNVGDTQIRIEPEVPVEGPIEQLRCASDGQISSRVSEENSSLISFGKINLALAKTSAKSNVFGDEELTSIVLLKPADSETGYIQSGWLLKRESLLDRFQKVSFGEVAILFVAGGILIQLWRMTPKRQEQLPTA